MVGNSETKEKEEVEDKNSEKGRSISIFGATGSVGRSAVHVITSQPDWKERYNIRVVTAGTNVDALAETAVRLGAEYAVIADASRYNDLKQVLFSHNIKALAGTDELVEAAKIPVDWTMAAIVGMAGLRPLVESIKHGSYVAIANKEPLVSAGFLVMELARKCGTVILPVDSEHNAIFQVFERENKNSIRRIILTASGGPFRTLAIDEMENITPQQALKHPNWSMGAKISIDSATMMNKALEVVEACHLFDMEAEKIDVLVHPQSVIHSMVEYDDGSILAQMGAADMKTPIASCLGYPGRVDSFGERLDFLNLSGGLTFEPVDNKKFPFVQMAYAALKSGADKCIAMNAANEIAVNAFLENMIGFTDIYRIVEKEVEICDTSDVSSLDEIIALDNSVRERVRESIGGFDSLKQKAGSVL